MSLPLHRLGSSPSPSDRRAPRASEAHQREQLTFAEVSRAALGGLAAHHHKQLRTTVGGPTGAAE